MAEEFTFSSFVKSGRKYIMTLPDGSSMHWSDLNILNEWIDNGSEKTAQDRLNREMLKRIRNADPTFANIGNLTDITYEQPDVRVRP